MRVNFGLIKSLLAVIAVTCGTGCGGYMARRLAQAPNTYPRWLAPAAPVNLAFDSNYLTNWAVREFEVGPPPARLSYRVVDPGRYDLKVTSTNWVEHGRPRFRFRFTATVPAPADPPPPAVRGTVMLLHCYAGDQLVMAPWALRLAEEGWRCVLVDLRGHGRSTGDRIYYGVREVEDLRQLLSHLDASPGEAGPVAVLGYSYGASLALRWQSVDPRITSAVAIAPYAVLSNAVLNVRREYAPLLPEACVRAGVAKLPAVLGVPPDDLDPRRVLTPGTTSALLIAGANDRITPVDDVRDLQELLGPHSELVIVPGATHESLPFCVAETSTAVVTWLDRGQCQPGKVFPGPNRARNAPPGRRLDRSRLSEGRANPVSMRQSAGVEPSR